MGVAKGDQLGSPERIREKMKMVRKQPKATTEATHTELGGVDVELQVSQERERTLQARIAALSQRATTAEERATTAEETVRRVTDSEYRAREAERMAVERAATAEERTATAVERAATAEERAATAEERAATAEERATTAEDRIDESQRVAEEANRRAQEAERRAAEAERRPQIEDQPFWAVGREEIQFTGETLGTGGWAEVRVAKFRGVQIAAKCLHSQIVSPYNRDLFIREMNMAARVRHPNLLLFIGATLQGELTILTELMPTSLRALLQPGTPPAQQQLVSLACDIARALNYFHLMKPDPIIHRDVSSANVLLDHGGDNSWRAKLSDYGTVKLLQQVETVCPGNPTYAAPEANYPAQQTSKMDIFSFGVLLVEMCTARFPDPATRERFIRSIREPRLVGLVRQCTAEDKDRRPSAADIITQLTEL